MKSGILITRKTHQCLNFFFGIVQLMVINFFKYNKKYWINLERYIDRKSLFLRLIIWLTKLISELLVLAKKKFIERWNRRKL
jgi:hypothetical protein